MRILTLTVLHILLTGTTSLASYVEKTPEAIVYRGSSDASAAVAVAEDMFIVADDENNTLRIYRIAPGGLPLFAYNTNQFLDIEPKHPEVDIEGATRIGQRVYWISSHGRNRNGKIRPNRYRFFATSIESEDTKMSIAPVGKPCKTFVHSLVGSEKMNHLKLDAVTRLDDDEMPKRQRRKLAPKQQGLNIESLCACADGKTIYIGLRNPLFIDRASRQAGAIVIPLKNPDAVLEKNQTPSFGKPILLNLDGLGIRSMEYSHFHQVYFIVAGSSDDRSQFALYRWSGQEESLPVLVNRLNEANLSPEAIVTFESSGGLLILSDDGSLRIEVDGPWECAKGRFGKDGTCQNKHLINPVKKTFRGFWLRP
jgi:hypothetical protein